MEHKSENNSQAIPLAVVGELCDAFQRKYTTLYRWLRDGHDLLTSDKAKEIFTKHGIEYVAPKKDSKAIA